MRISKLPPKLKSMIYIPKNVLSKCFLKIKKLKKSQDAPICPL